MWWSTATGRPKETCLTSTRSIILCGPNTPASTSYTWPSTSPAPTGATAAPAGSACSWGTSSPVRWTFKRGQHRSAGSVGRSVRWRARSCWRRWRYPNMDWATGGWRRRAPDWDCSSWIKVDYGVLQFTNRRICPICSSLKTKRTIPDAMFKVRIYSKLRVENNLKNSRLALLCIEYV